MQALITLEGEKKIRADLERMTGVERPEIIEAIATARAHGDLKENAEYHAAREQQSFLEGRIAELESALSNAQVIDVKSLPKTGKIVFGTTVNIYNTNIDAEQVYTIVGDVESDANQNKISISSPIAQALIGKEVGDTAEIKAPMGNIEIEILSVKY